MNIKYCLQRWFESETKRISRRIMTAQFSTQILLDDYHFAEREREREAGSVIKWDYIIYLFHTNNLMPPHDHFQSYFLTHFSNLLRIWLSSSDSSLSLIWLRFLRSFSFSFSLPLVDANSCIHLDSPLVHLISSGLSACGASELTPAPILATATVYEIHLWRFCFLSQRIGDMLHCWMLLHSKSMSSAPIVWLLQQIPFVDILIDAGFNVWASKRGFYSILGEIRFDLELEPLQNEWSSSYSFEHFNEERKTRTKTTTKFFPFCVE